MPRWQLVTRGLAYAAEEAGSVLRRTAVSPNIRDRLDYSVAVLDPEGRLVAQAEHIPVHLGALAYAGPRLVEALEEAAPPAPGTYYLTNNPYLAGTHLNDVTVAAPVYAAGRLAAWVAVKAHIVDLGGSAPGGVAGATSIEEEGVLLEPSAAARDGRLEKSVLDALASRSRSPAAARIDVYAELAAARHAAAQVASIAERYGAAALREAMEEAIAYAERYTAAALEELGGFQAAASDVLEGASRDYEVKAVLHASNGRLHVRLEAPPQPEEPLNATLPSTAAAVAYAARSILDPGIPVNHGFYQAVRLDAQPGSLVAAEPPAPVGAYTETVQRIVDAVYAALHHVAPGRVPAASCGTMSSVALGAEHWAFYETIACGQGAARGRHGASAHHTHMTNTLNTPIEVLEAAAPVRVLEYRVRRGSGGDGKWRGGDGVRRVYLLEADAELAVATNRARHPPWGLEGGCPAAPARVLVREPGRPPRRLPPLAHVRLPKGSLVEVETPGGGGYGAPSGGCG